MGQYRPAAVRQVTVDGKVYGIPEFCFFGAKNRFVKDQLGAFPMEDWYLNVLAEASPDVDITVTPFKDRQGNPITFVTGSAWAIPKGAKNPNAACRLARTMTEASTARHGGLDERLQAPPPGLPVLQGWQEHVEPVGVAGALGLRRPPPLVLPDQPPKRGG
jgi:hypothetical protein